uniref:Phosphate-binding protein n=1 Tax=Thermodesulfobacterium geofontis TaxID=1295609 RepID=A0A7C4NTM1_9BACT
MMKSLIFKFWCLLIIIFCILSPSLSQAIELTGAGATFPQPVIEAWAYEYYKLTKVKINYQGIGSGGGIKQAQERTVDFGATDKPLASEELRKYNLVQFPFIIGAVVITYNLPELKNISLNLDHKAICDIYLGKIKNWNDPYLKKLNSKVNLPERPIIVVRRSDGSGTTWLFTTYLSKACPEWREKVGAGTSVNWPVGIGAKGNPGVTNYVKQNTGAIGYVEFIYAKQNNLPMANLLNAEESAFVSPSVKSMQSASTNVKWEIEKDFFADLTYQPGKNSYPITGASFILIPLDKPNAKEVTKFFKWAFEKGGKIAEDLYYIPLPKNLVQLIYKYWGKYKINP